MPISPAYTGYFHRDNTNVRAVCDRLDSAIQGFSPSETTLHGHIPRKEALSLEERRAVAELYLAAGWGAVVLSGLSGDQRLSMPAGTLFFTLYRKESDVASAAQAYRRSTYLERLDQ